VKPFEPNTGPVTLQPSHSSLEERLVSHLKLVPDPPPEPHEDSRALLYVGDGFQLLLEHRGTDISFQIEECQIDPNPEDLGLSRMVEPGLWVWEGNYETVWGGEDLEECDTPVGEYRRLNDEEWTRMREGRSLFHD